MGNRQIEFTGKDGVVLAGTEWGQQGSPSVIFLHGGGQTRHSWGDTARRLSTLGWHTLALDQRGHGDSGWAPSGTYEIDDYVDDFCDIYSTLSRPPVLVGASLGGIVGLLSHGERGLPLSGLVLVDIALTIRREGASRIDEFMRSNVNGFASLDDAAEAIASYLPHRKRPSGNAGLEKNLRRREDGRWYWHWDPNILNDDFRREANRAERLKEAAKRVSAPTLLVRGALSDVLSEEAAVEFKEHVPHSSYVNVAGAAHMVAGDNNDVFADAVELFLSEITRDR